MVRLSVLAAATIVLSGHASARRGQSSTKASAEQGMQTFPAPKEPSGSDRCLFCHPVQVKGYARSAMSHSLRRAGQEPDGTVIANGSKITMYSSPAGCWQRWENGGDKAEYRVDFVIGSGNHANGYFVNLGGHLFQSPVAYYRTRQSYDLAPGFENQPDPDFTRPISEECVLCHSGTALHIPGTLNQYRSPVFVAEAITCERCHGPAERHLADPRATMIVNPAKLEPAARNSVCEQCHLFGVARVANPGKELADFVPGERLEDTYTTYVDANPTGNFKVISHVEQLALSACARKSGGRLWCGTCHDPHDKPLQPVEFYRSRCLACHAANFPAAHPAKESDCVACHMPRRAAKDGGHSAFTDHRIQRREETRPDVPADSGLVAWREPSADLQTRNLGIAYIQVGIERHSPSFITHGYRALTEVQQQFAYDDNFFRWIGEALLAAKQTAEAKIAFERALELDPNSAGAQARAAGPYLQEGDLAHAIAYLERAVALDPLDLVTSSLLNDLYAKQGRAADSAELSSRIKAAMSTSNRDRTPATIDDTGKKTEEVFKNIQVLKGIPSAQLIPAMRFISSSLGVPCSFCHVEGHFEADDKKPKQMARDMMQMMFTLNRNNFADHREVTCYSCHRGALNPVATPVRASEMPAELDVSPGAKHLPSSLPTVSELIDHYIQALGGATAIEKVTSRVAKGTAQFRDRSVSVEVYIQAPGRQCIVRHLPEKDSIAVFDGRAGWLSAPGRPVREMHDAELAAARMDADLQLPLHIRQFFPALRVQYPEPIGGGRNAYVLSEPGTGEEQAPVKLYFDPQSGLLVRLVRYAESPLGLDPTQIDYADYRAVDGVEVPFRATISDAESVSLVQFQDVQQNVPIDDARFTMPGLHH